MRINNNIPSVHTQGALFMNNRAVSKSLERLSTGLRVNRASDDAAGLAVSEGLRTQIRGQQQAKRNALDGISALNIAEGAMGEVHNIMQRQRELAIQAANNTYSETERGFLDQEFQALSEEIDRIMTTTNFNGIRLFSDPDRDPATQHAGANESNRGAIQAWDNKLEARIREHVISAARLHMDQVGSNGVSVSTEGQGEAWLNAIVNDLNRSLNALKDSQGRFIPGTDLDDILENLNNGTLSINDLLTDTTSTGTWHHPNGIWGTEKDGTTAATSPNIGFSIENRPEVEITVFGLGAKFNGEHLWIDANDVRNIDSIEVRYGRINKVLSRIDGIDSSNAQSAIADLDLHIQEVSAARAAIGAIVNRLESTITNLTTSIVNQSAAEAQIRDADFAYESSVFTRNQIMVQSATSMLAQANAVPQGVLSLIRG